MRELCRVITGTNGSVKCGEDAMYEAVQTSRLYDQTVLQIKESTLNGIVKVEDQLSAERELAQQFGFSCTAAREAVLVMHSAKHDPDDYIEADLDFHRALAEAGANPLVLSLIDSIVAALREQRMRVFKVEGSPERGQYHHKRILDAIGHHDSQGAREAMRAHLHQVREDSRTESFKNSRFL
jgi:DNA-binding FadR family transcriptional regulator